jgi:large subunit ribosomal protein L10
MAKPNKIEKVAELKERLGAAKGIYLTDFQGMNVAMATDLRNRCRAAGVRFEVVKNTLTRRALDESVRAALEPFLNGPTAVATSEGDEIAAAKVIADFIKEFERPVIKAGVVEGRVIDGVRVTELAKLPSKQVLLGRLLGGLKSPVQKLHSALSSPLRNLASVLKQVAEKPAP